MESVRSLWSSVAVDVRLANGAPEGEGGRSWSNLEFARGIPEDQWIRLRYQTSFYDPLVRPIIRLRTDRQDSEQLMSAGLFGSGRWIGYIPRGTKNISISPAMEQSRCGCDRTSYEIFPRARLLFLGLSRNAPSTLLALWLRLMGARTEARKQLRSAFGSRPLTHYHEWRAGALRAFDAKGLDAPRVDWRLGPHIRLVMEASAREASDGTNATMESLKLQHYPHWSVAFIGSSSQAPKITPSLCVEDERQADILWADLKETDTILPLVPGDVLPPYALAVLAEYLLVHADLELVYADEDSMDGKGRYFEPELKPDWSPIFQESRFYVGRASYFRVSALSRIPSLIAKDVLRPEALWQSACQHGAVAVGHIRRILLTKAGSARDKKRIKPPGTGVAAPVPRSANSAAPYATIIIPTKDRADLLSACLSSLAITQPRDFEVLIVDNGSQQAVTWTLYETMKADPRFHLLVAPGPFNFSTLCNRAASGARGRTLVFLNNDTVAIQENWLSELARWATRPGIGGVGARLLYPSGRLQHGGLATGLRGYAAHFDRGVPRDHPGYLNRLTAPREVSAVTGACLAVEKVKFNAVGGFDSERYPIELGDVDLCLRLSALGWKTIFTPDVTLIHHESATRRRTLYSDGRYAHEKRHFSLRWKSHIRDDPYFHPALSLSSYRAMLEE
jgi:O-antigen biosynthesis protein